MAYGWVSFPHTILRGVVIVAGFRRGDPIRATGRLNTTTLGSIEPGTAGEIVGTGHQGFEPTADVHFHGALLDKTVRGVPVGKLEGHDTFGTPHDPAPFQQVTRYTDRVPEQPVSNGGGELLAIFGPPTLFMMVFGGLFFPPLFLLAGWLGSPWLASHDAQPLDSTAAGGTVILFIVAGVFVLRAALRPTPGSLALAVTVASAAWAVREVVMPRFSSGHGGRPYLPELSGLWSPIVIGASGVLLVLLFCSRRWAAPRWVFPGTVMVASLGLAAWVHSDSSWLAAPSQSKLWGQLRLQGYPLQPETAAAVFFLLLAALSAVYTTKYLRRA